MQQKKQYSKPKLVRYGSVEQLTQASVVGGPFDAAFNVVIVPNTVQSS